MYDKGITRREGGGVGFSRATRQKKGGGKTRVFSEDGRTRNFHKRPARPNANKKSGGMALREKGGSG